MNVWCFFSGNLRKWVIHYFIKNFLKICFENNLAKCLNGYISFWTTDCPLCLVVWRLQIRFDGF